MEQMIKTRFTERFGIPHPVMLAPMDKVAGGRLAAAVSHAGGLGLIGGGYGDAAWLERAFGEIGNAAVGVGFITWSLLRKPELIAQTLVRQPAAFMVSFGDGEEAVAAARDAGVPTIWQIQRLSQAEQALAAEVDVIVVQGQEAGGHGMDRGLTALLPAVRDLAGPEQIILAAGGLADGRGLAASLMLGADGVMLGTRFWASAEAEGSEAAKAALLRATGDGTLRSKVFDIARNAAWPEQFTGRTVANAFARQWQDDLEGLRRNAESERTRYDAAHPDDYETRVLIAGEALDLIDKIESAETIVTDVVREAAGLLRNAGDVLVTA
ncbi:NAD(P)H-dependent flavin oxidoreductase [Algihabitans albus]|uniref:NAD(P)H-dependent flavin oxidoreductase n=1 Tax=Algihabitans albus TaxID=2164067 RepID=UPI001ABC3904|nr:nitronate monooxygenase [Algihabitans albus]